MSLFKRTTVIAAVATLAASAAQAQDISAAPTFGTHAISGGFQPDPMNFQIVSGGELNAAETIGRGCQGYVTNAPDVRINYTPGSLPLIISVNSTSDTTLVINAPDGSWICDDDSGNFGTNPSVTLRNVMPGQYDIWVGSYTQGDAAGATLSISELTSY
jgi:hypothetical protein